MILALTTLAALGGAGLAVFYQGSPWLFLQAGGAVFLTWALTRELDPDRVNSALLAGFLAGIWALTEQGVALLPLLGMLLVARLLVESTGRRPLTTDVLTVAALAAAISFSPLGFVAGFGIAVALYLDDMMSRERESSTVLLATTAALGSALVATLAKAFGTTTPALHPALVAAFVILALAAVRVPPQPTSQVDSRRKTFIRQDRLQAARVIVGLLTVLGGLLGGAAAAGLVPVAVSLGTALVSSEAERATRARL